MSDLVSDPGASDAYNQLGRDALAAGDAERAVALFAQAILIAPREAHTHVNMAAAYLALDRLGEAESHARRAVALDPELAEAHHNLGNALFAAGDADGAVAAFSRARALAPELEAHWTNFLFAQPFAEKVDGRSVDGSAIFAENRAWGARLEQRIGPQTRPSPRDRTPDRRLKLAYVLPELDAHVTARFLAPVLAAHDCDHFEISLYGDRIGGGALPSLLMPPGVRWADTFGQSADATAASMRRDQIDVLIHPCTFKARYRTILAHRAAPLQMAGINFVSSTGLRATDYLLSDAMLTPPGAGDGLFTEALTILPVFNCYGVPGDAPAVSPLPAQRTGFIRFGSFNNPAKLGARALDAWAVVLRALPASRLLLKHRAFDDPAVRDKFVARFAAQGVGAERLDFAGFTASQHDYLEAYGAVDIALDAMPFNGGTTSYEAIWMGVPVLTLAGEILMSRQTASLMAAVGQPEFITISKEAFVAKALELSNSLNRLAAIRAGLRGAAAATLFNGVRYTRSLESAVRAAWRAFLQNPPAD